MDTKLASLGAFKDSSLALLWQSLRPHYWSKNFLLILPVLLQPHLKSTFAWQSTVTLFVAFSLVASSVYLFNDFVDGPWDALDSRKQDRPFASGQFSRKAAGLAIFVLIGVGVSAFASLRAQVLPWIFAYVFLNVIYTVWAKTVFLVDMLFLVGFHLLRYWTGCCFFGLSIDVLISWALVFFFLWAGLLKKLASCPDTAPLVQGRTSRYWSNRKVILFFAALSAFLFVASLGLAILGPTVRQMYSQPELLFLPWLGLIFWIFTLTQKARLRPAKADAVQWVLTEPLTYFTMALWGGVFLWTGI